MKWLRDYLIIAGIIAVMVTLIWLLVVYLVIPQMYETGYEPVEVVADISSDWFTIPITTGYDTLELTEPNTQTFTITGLVELDIDLIVLSDTFVFKPIGDGYFQLVFRHDSSAVSNTKWTIFEEQPCEE